MGKGSNALLARAHALYAKRLTAEDYTAMMNLRSHSELFAYLKQNTSYGEYLESFSWEQFSSIRFENAIHHAQHERIVSLCRFEKLIGERLYRFYVRKGEVETILYCARHLKLGSFNDLSLMPDFFKKEQCISIKDMMLAKNLDELADSLSGTPYEKFIRSVSKSNAPWALSVLENSLYSYLYSQTASNVKKLIRGKAQNEILEHFAFLSDMIMISSLTRLNEHYIQTDSYKANIYISPCSNFSEKEISLLTRTTTKEQIMGIVYSSYYKKYFDKNDNSPIEHRTRKAIAQSCAKNIRFSQNPIVSMLCYCTIAENEIKNITHIIEGIRYHLAPEEISQLIVKGESVWQ